MKNTMKKIMSIMLAAMMLLSVGVTAFAGSVFDPPASGTPIGSAAEQKQFVDNEMKDYHRVQVYPNSPGTVFRYEGYIRSGIWDYRILDDGTVAIDDSRSWVENYEYEKELTVPSTIDGYKVTRIDSIYCTNGSQETYSVIIPDTVTAIGYNAIDGVELRRIVIPTSVKSINIAALAGGYGNLEIYYCGTEEQWNDIIAWSWDHLHDENNCAVTNFNWYEQTESAMLAQYSGEYQMIKEIHFNGLCQEKCVSYFKKSENNVCDRLGSGA